MYTVEQFDQQEQEEHSLALEAVAMMLLSFGITQSELEYEIRNFYQQYGKDGKVTYAEARKWISSKDRRRRIAVLYLLVGTKFNDTFDGFSEQFEDHLRKIILSEMAFFGLATEIIDVTKLLKKQWGIDSLTWNERLNKYRSKWAVIVNNRIKVAILQRMPINDLLDELKELFETMEKEITLLVTTETTAVGSMARLEIFKQMGVDSYKFYSRDDERVCSKCVPLHGEIFPLSAFEVGVTASPLHPRCRCWEEPIVD